MKHFITRRTVFFIALVLFAIGGAFFTTAESGAAGCGACLGPVNSSAGTGSGNSCAAAKQAAESDAVQAAPFGLSCTPCETSLTSSCSDIVQCQSGAGCTWTASATYNYKCKTCTPF